MTEIMIDLQGGAKAPLYQKIYEAIKQEIAEGRIPMGEKLPSTRLLSRHLSVSRSTVEMAYDQLLAEGYIEAEPCRGFFACDVTELYHLNSQTEKQRPTGEQIPEPENGMLVDFSPYAIDTESFPYNIWRKISKNVLLDDNEELLLSGDGQGEYELRREIAGYLHQARGVNCCASEIIVGAGNEYLEILLAQLLGPGKSILMENPGYPQAYRTFCNMGYEVKTVPAGSDGISMEALNAMEPDYLYIMPSHQFPLGTVLPMKQRLELLSWASGKNGRYLIEDDHDSEYRYRGKPIPSLQSIDRMGRVIYLGTFSKSIAPSLRISYMVLPPELMEQYRLRCGFYSATVPRMQQEILCAFIRDGHFERHLNKMRGIYRSRHDYLLNGLKKLDWAVSVSGAHAGLHLLVKVKTSIPEEELCRLAFAHGVRVSGLSEYDLTGKQSCSCPRQEFQYILEKESQEAASYPVLLLGYGKLCETEIAKGLAILNEILEN